MTQGLTAALGEDVVGDRTAKCLAEISELIGSKLARNQECMLKLSTAPLQLEEAAPHTSSRETSSSDEYRAMADICINLTREPIGHDQRRACLTLARACLRAAMLPDPASSKLPVPYETSNAFLFDHRVRDGYRSTNESLPNVRYKPSESQLYSVGSRDQSAKPISRGPLQIAIIALTIGAIAGAGAVLALIRQPSHQYTAAVAANTPTIAANYSAPEPAHDGQKGNGETLENAAPRWPMPLATSDSLAMNSPSSEVSDTPDRLSHATDRTSALDVLSRPTGAANKAAEDARPTERATYPHNKLTHRHMHLWHRYRYALYRRAFHRYAFRVW
jgi:hypothetical protein